MHRLSRLLILGIFTVSWLGCGAPPETIAGNAAELYVDQTTGHGPFTLDSSSSMWDHGEVQMWDSTGHGYGVRGNFVGYDYYFVPPSGVVWFASSPHYTNVYACRVASGGGCLDGVAVGTSFANLGWTPAFVTVHYTPPCPLTPGETVIRYCTGAYTPFDQSGYVTAVISDGAVQVGLPDGHPLNLQNAGAPVSAVECIANLANYSLPGSPTGFVAAVYGCP